MATDCFGNPSPYPPGIADCFADIERFRLISFSQRYAYLNARADAMVGSGTIEAAWELYWAMVRDLYALAEAA